jgi:hypothetical protein
VLNKLALLDPNFNAAIFLLTFWTVVTRDWQSGSKAGDKGGCDTASGEFSRYGLRPFFGQIKVDIGGAASIRKTK